MAPQVQLKLYVGVHHKAVEGQCNVYRDADGQQNHAASINYASSFPVAGMDQLYEFSPYHIYAQQQEYDKGIDYHKGSERVQELPSGIYCWREKVGIGLETPQICDGCGDYQYEDVDDEYLRFPVPPQVQYGR